MTKEKFQAGDKARLVKTFVNNKNDAGESLPLGVVGTIRCCDEGWCQWVPTKKKWRAKQDSNGAWHLGDGHFEKADGAHQDVFTFADWHAFYSDENVDRKKEIKRSKYFPEIIAVKFLGGWYFCLATSYASGKGTVYTHSPGSFLRAAGESKRFNSSRWNARFFEYLEQLGIV